MKRYISAILSAAVAASAASAFSPAAFAAEGAEGAAERFSYLPGICGLAVGLAGVAVARGLPPHPQRMQLLLAGF